MLTHSLLHHQVKQGQRLIVRGLADLAHERAVVCPVVLGNRPRRPGPAGGGRDRPPDLLYPQMTDDAFAPGWRPQFGDYLYVSLTNAAAFSPTDTMPLTLTVKALMGLQSLVSLVTIGLIVSRAVNIL